MAVPKHRTSKQKKRQRRSHWHLSPPNLINCTNCGNKKKSHIVCKNCGFYRDKQVINMTKNKSESEQSR